MSNYITTSDKKVFFEGVVVGENNVELCIDDIVCTCGHSETVHDKDWMFPNKKECKSNYIDDSGREYVCACKSFTIDKIYVRGNCSKEAECDKCGVDKDVVNLCKKGDRMLCNYCYKREFELEAERNA